jgi:hypothetical protein
MGDHVADMLRTNQALSTSAMTLIDATRKLIDTHADNGQGLHTLTKFEKDPAPASRLPGKYLTRPSCLHANKSRDTMFKPAEACDQSLKGEQSLTPVHAPSLAWYRGATRKIIR